MALRNLLALVALPALVLACTPAPSEAGRALGERHAQALEAGTLDLHTMTEELERAKAELETREDERAFERAYSEEIRPVRGKIVELAADEAATAIGEAGEQMTGEVQDLFQGMADSIEEGARSLDDPETKEKLREAGREFGRVMKKAQEALEAAAEGIEEGLDEAAAEPTR